MTAALFGNPEVDLGSNDQEFWFWIKRADPPRQYYCTYKDLEEGRVRHLPFPFQPEWILEAMGLGQYGPATRYQLVVEPEVYKLVERTKSPQGTDVRKVIVIQRRAAQGNAPQVTEYLLLDDATSKEICSAHVTAVQRDPRSLAALPYRIELRWPAARLKLAMRLDGMTVNAPIPQPEAVFVRRPQGVPAVDLARLQVQPSSLQRVRGTGQ
jgi:hypothetical protein